MTDGTLTHLASMHVAGRPYTVSEYNHPMPNSYAAEGFPMLAAYGRFQHWDGIFMFTYTHSADFTPDVVDSFFNVAGETPKMAHMIACSNLFLRGDAKESLEVIKIPFSEQRERDLLYEYLNPRAASLGNLGIDPEYALVHGIELDMKGQESPLGPLPETKKLISDTRQILYDMTDTEKGIFIVRTPKTIVLTGFLDPEALYNLGDIAVRVGETRLGWATISITSIDGEDLTSSGRVLVAATGWFQNTDMELQELGDNRVTLCSKWGKAPVLCEGIPLALQMNVPADQVACYPLKPDGSREAAVQFRSENPGVTQMILGPEYKTVWYEIEIK